MNTKFFRWSLVPALALAVFAACSETGTPTEQLIGPDQAAFGKGKENAPGQAKKGARVKVRGKNGRETTYVLATGEGGLTASRTVYPGNGSQVVDIALPGIGGLRVPVRAVNKATTFSITTETRVAADGGEYLAIDLNAHTADALKTDVGRNGFATDVTLYLEKPAAMATLAGGTILWVNNSQDFREVQCRSLGGGVAIEGAACVVDNGGTLEARLKHFSIYTMGWGG
jgi:hypothetical protein